jgi:transcriptional regulator with XRE-family HTH domain
MSQKTIGERIKQLRNQKGLTQIELAKQMSVGNSTISNWESDRRLPSIAELGRLASFFGVSLDVFSEQGLLLLPASDQKQGSFIELEYIHLGRETSVFEDGLIFASFGLMMLGLYFNEFVQHFIFFIGFFMLIGTSIDMMYNQRKIKRNNKTKVQVATHYKVYFMYQKENEKLILTRRTMNKLFFLQFLLSLLTFFMLLYMIIDEGQSILILLSILLTTIYFFILFFTYRELSYPQMYLKELPYQKHLFLLKANLSLISLLMLILSLLLYFSYRNLMFNPHIFFTLVYPFSLFILMSLAYAVYRRLRAHQSSYKLCALDTLGHIIELKPHFH